MKIKIDGLTEGALEALKLALVGAEVEIVLSSGARDVEALAAPGAVALRYAGRRGLDFGQSVAETMTIVDRILKDAIEAHHKDDHLVVFDRLQIARGELFDFWSMLAAELNIPVSYFVEDHEDEDSH